jgi:integral membrane sensor domain MASE1
MRAKLMNLFNHQCKVLIMFVLISYFQLSFNYIIFPIFWLDSTRFQLGFNYVCWLCIR